MPPKIVVDPCLADLRFERIMRQIKCYSVLGASKGHGGAVMDIVRRDRLHFKCAGYSARTSNHLLPTIEIAQAEEAGDKAANVGFPGDLADNSGSEARQDR